MPLGPDAPLPLSFAQQRLWFLEQMDGIGPAYTLSLALDLVGPLDIAALQGALGEVVRRHEILRTVIRAVDDRPLPVVRPAAPSVAVDDLPKSRPDSGWSRRCAPAASGATIDWPRHSPAQPVGPFGPDRHLLALIAHHVAADGWSLSILGHEIGLAYRHARAEDGTPAPLPDLAIQYADYAAWQRQCLSGPELTRRLDRWRKVLDGAPAVLDLPADKPRPTVVSYRGSRQPLAIPAATLWRLEGMARTHGATPFVILFAAFALLLHRLGAPEDMVIGTPAANRTRPDLEPLIGLFINTLPLRVDLSGDPTFTELVNRVREVALDAFELQDTPFEKLVDALGVERDLSHAPLVQAMFTFQNVPPGRLYLDGIEVHSLGLEPGTSQFDLSLALEADKPAA